MSLISPAKSPILLFVMRMLVGLILLSFYGVGIVLGSFTFANAETQFIHITHSHPVANAEHFHDHHSEHGFHHDHQTSTAANDSNSNDPQPVQHSHCISISGAAAYCLRFESLTISPTVIAPAQPLTLATSLPDDPALASIFRPPIA